MPESFYPLYKKAPSTTTEFHSKNGTVLSGSFHHERDLSFSPNHFPLEIQHSFRLV